jgi:putative transposase
MAIREHKMQHPHLSINVMCRAMGKSKQAFYKQEKVMRPDRVVEKLEYKLAVLEKVKRMKKQLPNCGVRKIKYRLARRKVYVGRDMLFTLMRKNNMLVKRKRKYAITTQSKHWFKKYSDTFNSIHVEKPEQAFVSDITYVRIKDEFSYLSLVTDAYSKRIMGNSLSRDLSREGPVNALKEALQNRLYKHPLLHHSDRGFQYCSHDYVEMLRQNQVAVSMTETGSPYDNAIAERVNGILKSELGLDTVFDDHEQAQRAVELAIKRYNKLRPHLSCGYLTPNQAHKSKNPLLKLWKKRNRKIILNFESETVN